MKIGILYKNLFENPNSPKMYRELYRYYLSKDMHIESNAFAELLRIRYEEIVDDTPSSEK